MQIPFIGPSYNLRSRAADVQRTVNLIPRPIESGNAKTQWRFQDLPGLVQFANLGAEYRGGVNVNGRVFVVGGGTLYEMSSTGSLTNRGTLSSNTGRVGITFNTTQLVIADDSALYVMSLATNVLASTPSYPGGASIQYLDQYILFVHRTSQKFGWTAIGDAATLDALDFASAEGSPDNLVTLIVDHRELILLGTDSVEIWLNTGSDQVFERNQGAFIEAGCAAKHSVAKIDNTIIWLGQDGRGQGLVWKLEGYRPQRISTQAIEEKMQGIDLSGATAYTYQMDGGSYYCLNVPALNTTWAFDVSTGQWHERAELVSGDYTKHRGINHLFAFNKNLVGAQDGKMWEFSPTTYSNGSDVLCRSRVCPDLATPGKDTRYYGKLLIDCDKGYGGSAMLRYTNDGTAPVAGNWITRSLGATGNRNSRVQWHRLGSGRDRCFEIRVTDAVPWNPVAAWIE